MNYLDKSRLHNNHIKLTHMKAAASGFCQISPLLWAPITFVVSALSLLLLAEPGEETNLSENNTCKKKKKNTTGRRILFFMQLSLAQTDQKCQ